MSGKYVFDGDFMPRQVPLLEWARWMEEGDPMKVVVALDYIEGGRVSTVFLGLDFNLFDVGAPQIFETVVFDENGQPGDILRYSTVEQARAGHSEMLARTMRKRMHCVENGS